MKTEIQNALQLMQDTLNEIDEFRPEDEEDEGLELFDRIQYERRNALAVLREALKDSK